MIMLRRTLLTALVAMVIASPAVAQRSKGGDEPSPMRTERMNPERPDRVLRQAQFPRDQWAPQEDRNDRREREVPLSSILRDLRGKYGGQHLDAQKMGDTYRISWITGDGRRLVIEVDAATGRTISVRG